MTHEEFEDLAALDAVGALDESEAMRLEEHLGSCASCSSAADEYREAAAAFAVALPATPPPANVKEQVMDAIQNRAEINEDIVEAHESKKRMPVWWLATAATFFLALFAWSELRLRMVRERLAEVTAAQNAATEENLRVKAANDLLTRQMQQLTDASTRMIALSGQEAAPKARARVFMNEPGKTALVFFQDLPPNPSDKSYQLWVIRGDQAAPQPAGVFDVGQTGQAQLKLENLPADTMIKAIAVTLEPRGGGSAPSGDKYLVGTL